MSSSDRTARCARVAVSIVLATVALGLASCGFKLQGRNRLPEYMSVVHVATEDPHTPFVRALRQSLQTSGVRISDRVQDAGTVVRVLLDESGERVLSVSARNTPEEYEVFYLLEYAVESRGSEVLEPQALRLERDYAYDETAVLAKQREEQQLLEAMARDLASRVMRRLATL